MSTLRAIESIKTAINSAPRNGYVAELHLQVLKHHQSLKNMTGKEFCAALDIGPSFGTEYSKMLKIAPRLIAAGLDVDKI